VQSPLYKVKAGNLAGGGVGIKLLESDDSQHERKESVESQQTHYDGDY